jgi:hypothetical protein
VTLLMENLDFMGSGDAVKNLLQPTGGSWSQVWKPLDWGIGWVSKELWFDSS